MTRSAATTAQLDNHLQQARLALRSGQHDTAMQHWQQVLKLEPDHSEALIQTAQLQLSKGDHASARALLEQALAKAPRLAMAHAYLARIHLANNDNDAALKSLDAAILHDPTAWGARLERAKLLEALGRHREAALNWTTALQSMPAEAAEMPSLRQLVAHAQQRVSENQRQLRDHLEAQVALLRQGESARDLDRYDHSLDILTGRRPFITAKPLMYPIPRLPAIPFFEREQFPWAAAVEAATPQITEELRALSLQDDAGFEPYVKTRPGLSAGQFSELESNADWSAYFLWKNGEKITEHYSRCPATVAALELAPTVHIRSHAPAALFSRLAPGTHIPPHNGATNSRLTVHLPLIVPDNCGFRVGDETRSWTPGELLIFDDTILHEAWNRSDSQRVVLIFDIWHPMLSMLERELVTATMEGMADYYGSATKLEGL